MCKRIKRFGTPKTRDKVVDGRTRGETVDMEGEENSRDTCGTNYIHIANVAEKDCRHAQFDGHGRDEVCECHGNANVRTYIVRVYARKGCDGLLSIRCDYTSIQDNRTRWKQCRGRGEGEEGVNRKRRYWQLLQLYGVGIFINTRTMRTRDKGKDYYRTRSHTPTRGPAVATVEDLRVPVMHSIIIHTCTQLVRVVLRRYCPVIDSPRAPVNTWRRSVYTYRIILTTKWHYQQTRIKYCNVIRIIQTRVCTF